MSGVLLLTPVYTFVVGWALLSAAVGYPGCCAWFAAAEGYFQMQVVGGLWHSSGGVFYAGGKACHFPALPGDNSRCRTVSADCVLGLSGENLVHKIPKAPIFLLSVREEHEVSRSLRLLTSL